ncbi:putative TBC1 domain family member 13 [Paratrimastix pyriformis]|uniref:TBC1 domain family member 13 n=1 Tax=Paratrimastix pyriformis TaxID=342808 RepID=A0ABQ8UQI6_9EUKA|nr:putative TBC1 domain family member 13 [Paratrimastix pyriformis]
MEKELPVLVEREEVKPADDPESCPMTEAHTEKEAVHPPETTESLSHSEAKKYFARAEQSHIGHKEDGSEGNPPESHPPPIAPAPRESSPQPHHQQVQSAPASMKRPLPPSEASPAAHQHSPETPLSSFFANPTSILPDSPSVSSSAPRHPTPADPLAESGTGPQALPPPHPATTGPHPAPAPIDPAQDPFATVWAEHLAKQRALFLEFVRMFAIDPRAAAPTADHVDHPLSDEEDSTWKVFFENQKIVDEIRKDIRRTCPDLHFFVCEGSAGPPPGPSAPRLDISSLDLHPESLCGHPGTDPGFLGASLGASGRRRDERDPGPIYYVFAQEPGLKEDEVQADAFWAFTTIMSERRDVYCKSLDQLSSGLQGSIAVLHEMIHRIDPALHADMEAKQIKPQFYGVRWVSLLLSQPLSSTPLRFPHATPTRRPLCGGGEQEYCMPDVLRIWDSLFADPGRFDLLLYLCLAMVLHFRRDLLAGSFSDNIKLLQARPHLPAHPAPPPL